MNPLQINDALLAGLRDGIPAAVSAFQDRMAEGRIARDKLRKARAWREYAESLERDLNELEVQYRVEQIEHAAEVQKFEVYVEGTGEYIRNTARKMTNLEKTLRTQSANHVAMELLRSMLTDALAKVSDPANCPLVDPKEQERILDKEWKRVMTGVARPTVNGKAAGSVHCAGTQSPGPTSDREPHD